MTTLAFMQNQWFKDPERVRKSFERYGEDFRRRFIHRALFAGCRTGRILRLHFAEACDSIVWEEASREIGGHASSVFPADPQHIAAVLRGEQPDVVLTFGKVALNGLLAAMALTDGTFTRFKVISGPHPTARGASVPADLRAMAKDYRAAL